MLTKIRLPHLIIGIIAIGLICLGFLDKLRLDALDKEGVTVAGNIVTGLRHPGRNTSYTLETVFTTQTGAQLRNHFTVSPQFFHSHMSDSVITDPSVQVRYQPSNTDNCILVGGSTDHVSLFPFGCLVLVVAIFVMYTMRGKAPLFQRP